jgi:transketolase
MQKEQIDLRRRIVELSYEAKVAHVGSALSNVDIIDAVYQAKKDDEKFVLSNGHAAAALYVVMEKYGLLTDPKINDLGVHPERNLLKNVEVSTGSLGQGLPIAVGMAMANRDKRTFCCVSDGECAEGSIWEALKIASTYHLNNLIVVVNANGYAGYQEIDPELLIPAFQAFGCDVIDVDGHDTKELVEAITIKTDNPLIVFARTRVDQLPFLNGLDAHYKVVSEENMKTTNIIWSKD